MPNLSVKLLFLSRKENVIECRLRAWPKVEIGGEGTTEGDIQHFVREKVVKLQSAFPSLKRAAGLEEDILKAACNIFLYVVLIEATIHQVKPSSLHAVKQIKSNLNNCGPLDTLYKNYFSRQLTRNNNNHNQIAMRALQWILYSPQPVTSSLLRVVLAIDSTDEGLDSDKLDDSIKVTVSTALGVLVSWQNTPDGLSQATLMHASLRDYLVHRLPLESTTELQLARNTLRSHFAHAVLLKTCSIITSSREVRMPLQEYYDSADKRRQLHDKHERRGWLQRQVHQNQSWESWMRSQLEGLDQEWQWRDKEEKRIRNELEELGREPDLSEWAEEQMVKLGKLQELRTRKSQEMRELTALQYLRERELMVYSLR